MMSPAAYRSRHAPAPFVGGMAVDDHELCLRILQLPLGETTRAQLQDIADGLTPGKFGQLSTTMRDKLWKFAVQNGAVQKPKKKRFAALSVHVDTYDTKPTPATERAAELIASQVPSLGGKMPTPPGRGSK